LDAAARAVLEEHLRTCESCRGELEAMQATREVLAGAATVEPKVDWRRADDQVHGSVERRLARLERPWTWSLAWAVGAGGIALAIALMAVTRRGPPVDPKAVALIVPVPAASEVHKADGALAMTGDEEHVLKAGEKVKPGTSLRTTADGQAIVTLPEGSRVRLGAASDLVLAKAATDEVDLVLKKGRVAIQATHAARKDFVVEAGGATIKVVGTAFSVGVGDKEVDLAVAEGKVLFELADGKDLAVRSGERVVLDRVSGEVRQTALAQSDKAEMAELGVEVALAAPLKPKPTPKGLAPVPLPGPVAAAPVQPPPEPVATAPVLPEPPPVEPTTERPLRLHPKPKPAEIHEVPGEVQFLHEFEQAIASGNCANYLPRSEEYLDIPLGDQKVDREEALILRARCFAKLGQMFEADQAFRRYLREFASGGKYFREARLGTVPP
jgi:hypothetical protein